MKRKNEPMKYLSSLILSDKETIINLVDLYNEKLKECFSKKYLYDDETIIDELRLDNPDLFSCID